MGQLLSFHLTFTQGFILGQLSIILLLALVLRYLFFGSTSTLPCHLPTSTFTTNHFETQSPNKNSPKNFKKFESVEWLNVILESITDTYRAELGGNQSGIEGIELARQKVEHELNSLRPPTLTDSIVVHSLSLGSASPRISGARIQPSSDDSQSHNIEFDMIYTDNASISFSTSILFSYPLPYFAKLPISLSLSLSVFAGKVVLSLPKASSPKPTVTFALVPGFRLELNINSLMGSRAKLADVPKLHDLIESEIKKVLTRRGSWTIVLPGIARQQGEDIPYDTKEIDVKLISERQSLPKL